MQGFDRRLVTYARSSRAFLLANVAIQPWHALPAVAPVVLLAEPTEHLDPAAGAGSLITIEPVTSNRSPVVLTRPPIAWLSEQVVVDR